MQLTDDRIQFPAEASLRFDLGIQKTYVTLNEVELLVCMNVSRNKQ